MKTWLPDDPGAVLSGGLVCAGGFFPFGLVQPQPPGREDWGE